MQKEKTKKQKAKEARKEFIGKLNQLFTNDEYRYSNKFYKEHVGHDGKAYINVDLTKCEDGPFSLYSYERRIDQEIYNYIDQEVFYLDTDIPVVVNFDDGGKYDNSLKNKIAQAVKRHYSLQYEDSRKELNLSNLIGLFTLIFGFVLLIAYIVLSIVFTKRDYNTVFIEIILIMSWMLIWNAMERFFFKGGELRREVYNNGQLALMEIKFGKMITND